MPDSYICQIELDNLRNTPDGPAIELVRQDTYALYYFLKQKEIRTVTPEGEETLTNGVIKVMSW